MRIFLFMKEKKYKVIDNGCNVLAEFDKEREAIDYYKKDSRSVGFLSPKPMGIPKRKNLVIV